MPPSKRRKAVVGSSSLKHRKKPSTQPQQQPYNAALETALNKIGNSRRAIEYLASIGEYRVSYGRRFISIVPSAQDPMAQAAMETLKRDGKDHPTLVSRKNAPSWILDMHEENPNAWLTILPKSFKIPIAIRQPND